MDRRGDDPGRRKEDSWRYTEIVKKIEELRDHIDEVDDYLRGGPVGEDEPMGVRVMHAEIKLREHDALMSKISSELSAIRHFMEQQFHDMRVELSGIKITDTLTKDSGRERTARIAEWLKFWGPIVLLLLTGLGWFTQYALKHHEGTGFSYLQRIKRAIAQEKAGPRGKAVRKKEAALERARRTYQPP